MTYDMVNRLRKFGNITSKMIVCKYSAWSAVLPFVCRHVSAAYRDAAQQSLCPDYSYKTCKKFSLQSSHNVQGNQHPEARLHRATSTTLSEGTLLTLARHLNRMNAGGTRLKSCKGMRSWFMQCSGKKTDHFLRVNLFYFQPASPSRSETGCRSSACSSEGCWLINSWRVQLSKGKQLAGNPRKLLATKDELLGTSDVKGRQCVARPRNRCETNYPCRSSLKNSS